MNENKPNVDEQEELDLSSMINEYEEDDDLRRKIESMKKQKELQAEKEEVVDSAFVDVTSTTNIPFFKNVKEEQVMTEDSLGETRQITIEDADKTLVIMDNERVKAFNSMEADKEEESIFEYDNKEVDEEEITEADIQEFLGEDNRIRDPRSRSMNADKKNKIITYCIIGCVALLVLGAVGFGVKLLLDDKEPAEKPKDEPTSDPAKPVDPKDPTEEPDTPKTDNSIRIAEIKGEIKGCEANINTLNGSLTNAQNRYNEAKQQADSIQNQISPLQSTLDNTLTPALEATNQKYTDLEKKVAAGDTTVIAERDEAKIKYDEANTAWNDQVAMIQKLENDKAPFNQAMKDANDEMSNINSKINEYNGQISAFQKELSSLQ